MYTHNISQGVVPDDCASVVASFTRGSIETEGVRLGTRDMDKRERPGDGSMRAI